MTWSTMMVGEVNKYTEEELEQIKEIKERERICNLSRKELIQEVVEDWSVEELVEYVEEYMDYNIKLYTDDKLRHTLLKNL